MSLSVTHSGTAPIYLYTAPADMRKGFAGLTVGRGRYGRVGGWGRRR